MWHPGLVARRMAGDRALVLAACVTALFATTVLAALVGYGGSVTREGLRRTLGDATFATAGTTITGHVPGGEFTRTRARVEGELRRIYADAPPAVALAARSDSYTLPGQEDAEVPLRLTRTPPAERDERVRVLLGLVGLADHAEQRPHELSGGQRQRVAIARALANRPRLLLADEPTGQLDSETAAALMPLLRAVVTGEGVTVVVATHDRTLLGEADRVLHLEDGAVTELPDDGRTDDGRGAAQPTLPRT